MWNRNFLARFFKYKHFIKLLQKEVQDVISK